VFGDAIRFHEFPSQCSMSVCQMLPFLCRPTPQQSEADTHVTATMSLTALPLGESTIVQLPVAGVEGEGAALFARKSNVEGRLSPPMICFEGAAAMLKNAPTMQRPSPASVPGLMKRLFAVGGLRIAREGTAN
jgi:hypothetical protein